MLKFYQAALVRQWLKKAFQFRSDESLGVPKSESKLKAQFVAGEIRQLSHIYLAEL